MTRKLLFAAPLLALAACNVQKDAANDSTTLSVDGEAAEQAGNTVESAADQAGNALEGAVGEVKNAAESAAPVVRNVAREGANAAKDVGQSVENGADRAAGEVQEETRDNPPAQR